MRIIFDSPANITEVLKFNTGIKPRYANRGSTAHGEVWCPRCNQCLCNMISENKLVIGWFETECKNCGNPIDWSEASNYL